MIPHLSIFFNGKACALDQTKGAQVAHLPIDGLWHLLAFRKSEAVARWNQLRYVELIVAGDGEEWRITDGGLSVTGTRDGRPISLSRSKRVEQLHINRDSLKLMEQVRAAYSVREFGALFGKSHEWARRMVDAQQLKILPPEMGDKLIPVTEIDRVLRMASQAA